MKLKDDLGLRQTTIGRSTYFYYNVVAYGVVIGYWFLLNIFPAQTVIDKIMLLLSAAIVLFLFFYVTLLTTIKRLRDLGHRPYFCLLLFVPYVNLAFILYLCLKNKKS